MSGHVLWYVPGMFYGAAEDYVLTQILRVKNCQMPSIILPSTLQQQQTDR